MVYATQVINTGDEYPSPSQFEEWKLEAQKGAEFSKSTLNLPVSTRSASLKERFRRPSIQLMRLNKSEQNKPAVILECEILEDGTKCPETEETAVMKSNLYSSVRDRPSGYHKANCSGYNAVEPSRMKSSTSLANIASDIVVVSAGWFSSLRRPGRKRKKGNESSASVKAKSAWDLSNLAKLVRNTIASAVSWGVCHSV
ncbi:hypothetical protein RUM43_004693 [Polyplax serrata]|uniref:Uncharacterized protein n=1 Tax=Polyplax serrata TaxID=468196 RepID=A0AAN8SDQ7_POLSC